MAKSRHTRKHGASKNRVHHKKRSHTKKGGKECGCGHKGGMVASINNAIVPAALFVSNYLMKGKKAKSGKKSKRYSRRR